MSNRWLKRCWVPGLLAGCMAVMAGCATSGGGAGENRGMNYLAEVNALVMNNQIRILERTVGKSDGPLAVQVVGQNVGNKELRFDYRFIWRSKDGALADVPTSIWMPAVLPAGAKVVMKGTAVSAGVEDFLLSVRAAK